MVTILIVSAKLATEDLLEIRYFEIKVITLFLSMTSSRKFYLVTKIIL